MIRLLNRLLLLTTCVLMQACLEQDYSGDVVVTHEKISGEFLLNNGERLEFAPECDYDGTDSWHCGLTFKGLEEKKQTYSYCRGGDFGCDSKTVVFDNTNADLSGIEITQKTGKSYKLDSTALIEPNENGIVDFTIKDAKKNEIHLQYNMSNFLKTIKDSIVVSDGGLYLNMEYYKAIDEQCNLFSIRMSHQQADETVFISDSLIRSCFAKENKSPQQKIAIATFQYSASIDSCETSPGVSDPFPIDPTQLWSLLEREYHCEQIVIRKSSIYTPLPLIYYVNSEPNQN